MVLIIASLMRYATPETKKTKKEENPK